VNNSDIRFFRFPYLPCSLFTLGGDVVYTRFMTSQHGYQISTYTVGLNRPKSPIINVKCMFGSDWI